VTKRATFTAADVARALSGAKKAGLTVASYEITAEGTIRVLTADGGAPLPSSDQDDEAWSRAMGTWRRSA
jgi:hypothetical protein